MPKISIIIVTYNSTRYLPDFLDSIFNQTYFIEHNIVPDIFIVDNASHDKTVKFIHDHYPTVNLMRNVNNLGLPRAWNQGITMTKGEYILIMNPDLILSPNFIATALKVMESDQTIGSVGGKLYQMKITSINDDELPTLEKTNILDSCGLQVFKNLQFIERGAGTIDKGQYNSEEKVFGIGGACVLYRRQALEEIKYNNEYFDEDFFIYQEDIDIAWRLRLAGWDAVYTPQAIGYHHRRAKSLTNASIWKIMRYRRQKENFVNFYSYRNHWLVLYKNLTFHNLTHNFLYILIYELKKFLYVLILENSTLRKTIKDLIKLKGKIKKKRHHIMRLTKVKPNEIEGWFI